MSNFYITTSIPYINGEPHLGHAMEFVIADALARYARTQGLTTLYATGTDEHGSKVAEKAAELKLAPKALADKNVKKFQELLQLLEVSNDRFIRTTDKGHEQRSQVIWKNIKDDIYKGTYIGWYCTGCEEFVTETAAKENKNICPIHKKPYEKIEEDNYFFKLSKYASQIRSAIESGSFAVIPESRKNEILGILNEGLEDISISRPKDKISWGVPVPGDTHQVIYVWFEALMNYITVLGYPEHQDFKTFWPADYQVIGKDILRFHAAIWPGTLLALGLPLPKNLYVHGFVTLNGQKMSKSTGNVVDPKEIISQYGADAFRYYFLRKIPSYGDGDFTWEHFEASYNNELGNELGNAVQRTVVMIEKFQQGLIGDIPSAEHDSAAYHEAMRLCRFDRALDVVWDQVRGLNQYIDEQKPWQIAKEKDEEHLREVLAYMVSCLLEIAELLEPFLPNSSQAIKNIFAEGLLQAPKTVLFPKIENYPSKKAE
ncbi:methionine--tRNA ligase [Candidatus Saccharibacteria bacterium]|nr:methionine--tRNA ligase [Candidatus Saccharibacteria bacterium]